MTNGIFGGAVLTAHKQETHTKCATKVAPPNILMSIFVIASEPIGRAWQATVCEARIMGILCRLIASAIASQ